MAAQSKLVQGHCSCRTGYYCKCDGRDDKYNEKKRKYNWNGTHSEKQVKASKLMKKRLDPTFSHPLLLKDIKEKQCCKSGNCLRVLYDGANGKTELYGWSGIPAEGFGTKLFDAVDRARKSVYHTGQYESRKELKHLLQRDVHEKFPGDLPYKFYHHGVLGSAPAIPSGIQVSASIL